MCWCTHHLIYCYAHLADEGTETVCLIDPITQEMSVRAGIGSPSHLATTISNFSYKLHFSKHWGIYSHRCSHQNHNPDELVMIQKTLVRIQWKQLKKAQLSCTNCWIQISDRHGWCSGGAAPAGLSERVSGVCPGIQSPLCPLCLLPLLVLWKPASPAKLWTRDANSNPTSER